MAASDFYRFNGQAGYQVDTGRLKKTRVVFAMIAVVGRKSTSIAWYLFSSDGVAKSKRELANRDPMPPEQFGHRTVGGREIPHTFKNAIDLDGLAINPGGTAATLTLEVSEGKRFISCRISNLTTKAKEVVTFPFGLQFDSVPSMTGDISGKVLLLEKFAPYDENKFILGPQGKSRSSITGPGA